MEPNEPINTKFYQLGNGGSLIFEHDLDSLSDHLGRPTPSFTGFRESNWLDGLARALQEALARLCGQNVEALREERFAHLARRNSDGRPMDAPRVEAPRGSPGLHALTQRDLGASRAYANQTHAHHHRGWAIKLLNNDQEPSLAACQEGRYDSPPSRRIASLEATNIANQGHGNHDHPGSKLKNFQNTNPSVFSKTEEPLDADDWLQTMENNLEVGVEANEKVLFATHYLAGSAHAWWTSTRAMNGGQFMTWEDFKLKFSKYHVPPGLIKKMRDEFRELKQGRMTVVEYRDKFLTLSRYAPDETDTVERGRRDS
ncbi:hypothetical protein QYE76_061350 [Lolium multiflorum]|uniref:Retrotransposon gag domain-containing protein n=1 Tax=Lolium multiflorum TaxID=4521 RepID=A0AAD8S306_LOLMU|nr:hypothetical protein QYE76_061350 [Lolium multiflorum]